MSHDDYVLINGWQSNESDNIGNMHPHTEIEGVHLYT